MTAQWQHQYILRNGDIISSSYSPFVPEEYGLIPGGTVPSSCHNAFLCEFQVAGKRCILKRLLIKLQPNLMDGPQQNVAIENYPLLNTIKPEQYYFSSNPKTWFAMYDNLTISFEEPAPGSSYEELANLSAEKQQNARQQIVVRYACGNAFDNFRKGLETKPKHSQTPSVNHTDFREGSIREYHIIGDIHGHADELEALLDKLGYSSDGRKFPKRKQIIFLGDFIDRGRQNRRVIEIVKTLVRTNLAFAVMGNHEYNAICYNTRSRQNDKKFLRKHSEKNKGQHQEFLNEFPDKEERNRILHWCQRLPIFIDVGHFRVIHACWDQAEIDFVKAKYGNFLTDDFLHKSVQKNSIEYHAIEKLLKGPEFKLAPGLKFNDNEGNPRKNVRLKWWAEQLNTLKDAAILPTGALHDHLQDPLSAYPDAKNISPYPEKDPPVLFGHYLSLPEREKITANTACLDFLDYKATKGKKLGALRWRKKDADLPLDKREIVSVCCDPFNK